MAKKEEKPVASKQQQRPSHSRMAKAAEIETRLAALEGPEWESDDEGDDDVDEQQREAAAAAAAQLATHRNTAADTGDKATPAGKSGKDQASRVIYVGHLPHGFYEEQLMGFFSQFGEVTRVRLARSRKTGGFRGYGFVEFADAEVAKISAGAMDRYLMSGKQLVCHVATHELATHPKLFLGHGKPFAKIDWAKLNAEKHNAPKDADQLAKRSKRLLKKDRQKRKRLEELGVDYAFEGYRVHDASRAARAAAAEADSPQEQQRSPGPDVDNEDAPSAKKRRSDTLAAAATAAAAPAPRTAEKNQAKKSASSTPKAAALERLLSAKKADSAATRESVSAQTAAAVPKRPAAASTRKSPNSKGSATKSPKTSAKKRSRS